MCMKTIQLVERCLMRVGERFIAEYFRDGEDGTEFFPFGAFGPGYHVRTPQQLNSARSWAAQYMAIALCLLFLTAIGLSGLPFLIPFQRPLMISRIMLCAAVVVWLLYPLGWVMGTRRLVRKLSLERTDRSAVEVARRVRGDIKGGRLLILIVGSLISAVIGSFRLAALPPSSRSVVDVVFWGGVTLVGISGLVSLVYVLIKSR